MLLILTNKVVSRSKCILSLIANFSNERKIWTSYDV